MSIQDLITVSANIALTLTFIVALVFGLVQAKSVERDRRERLTLETLRNFQTREFAQLLQFVTSTENFPQTQKEMDQLPPDRQTMFIQFAQQMESLGILVAENLIDLDLVDKTLGSFVVTSWKKYKVLFTEVRPRDPYIAEYFQWMAHRIAERMEKTPRDPFYLNKSNS